MTVTIKTSRFKSYAIILTSKPMTCYARHHLAQQITVSVWKKTSIRKNCYVRKKWINTQLRNAKFSIADYRVFDRVRGNSSSAKNNLNNVAYNVRYVLSFFLFHNESWTVIMIIRYEGLFNKSSADLRQTLYPEFRTKINFLFHNFPNFFLRHKKNNDKNWWISETTQVWNNNGK